MDNKHQNKDFSVFYQKTLSNEGVFLWAKRNMFCKLQKNAC